MTFNVGVLQLKIVIQLKSLGIGERLAVFDLAAMHDVAHGKLCDLSGFGAGNVGDRDNLRRNMAGARALALRAPLVGSPATQAVADFVNGLTGGPGHDRFLSPEMEAVANAVRSGEVLDLAESFLELK